MVLLPGGWVGQSEPGSAGRSVGRYPPPARSCHCWIKQHWDALFVSNQETYISERCVRVVDIYIKNLSLYSSSSKVYHNSTIRYEVVVALVVVAGIPSFRDRVGARVICPVCN